MTPSRASPEVSKSSTEVKVGASYSSPNSARLLRALLSVLVGVGDASTIAATFELGFLW
eukprot:CAMPEP_0185759602 /NCGR_PEP_ID=MMETSP1174-20130828/18350_1 /TAXON_ID=35687 /ORGANISM="Dictyocha speculum, Strain CCMP1381" /LENGTH=58 /DNA_ID=CAMNT_0028439997 /DNA_START=54 /DNA_END=227 /DNA_ORIENTATION=+